MYLKKEDLMYSFDELYAELRGAIALKTLKSWAIKIEKVTDRRFKRYYAKNSVGNKYSYKVFTVENIKEFNELLLLRQKKIPLEEAIKEVFMSDEEKEKRKEVILSQREFDESKEDIKELIELTKNLLRDNINLQDRISKLEGNRINDL